MFLRFLNNTKINKERNRFLSRSLFYVLSFLILFIALSNISYSQSVHKSVVCGPCLESVLSGYNPMAASKANHQGFLKDQYTKKIRTNNNYKIKDDSTDSNWMQIREDKSNIYITVHLVDEKQSISIQIFNMLGKKVLDVWNNNPQPSATYQHSFAKDELVNGVYLCVVQGQSVVMRDKLTVSK